MDPVTSGLDPTVPLQTFANTTIPTGGDSRLYNLNVFYSVSFLALARPESIHGLGPSLPGGHAGLILCVY
jgi:hypothetical protein